MIGKATEKVAFLLSKYRMCIQCNMIINRIKRRGANGLGFCNMKCCLTKRSEGKSFCVVENDTQ